MNQLRNVFNGIEGIDKVTIDRDEGMIFVYGNSEGVKKIINLEGLYVFEIGQIECIGKDLYMVDVCVY